MSTTPPFALSSSPRLYSDVIQSEAQDYVGYCKDIVVANEAADTTYVIGQVLGKVTSSGKYKALKETATDGSQNFAAIYVGQPADTGEYRPNVANMVATVDQEVVAFTRGPATVGKAYLVFGTGSISPTQKAAVYAQMLAAGIKLLDQV